jgi:hypothetical protein
MELPMNTILLRFKEPSTWAALASLMALAGINMPPEWAVGMAGGVAAVAGLVAAAIAVFAPEKGTPPEPLS